MTSVIHVKNDLLTPYELRTKIFRVNVVLNTDHSGDPKIFFGRFSENFFFFDFYGLVGNHINHLDLLKNF